MTDKTIARELLEERAALIEEGEGCVRQFAEALAARMHGFNTWKEAMEAAG